MSCRRSKKFSFFFAFIASTVVLNINSFKAIAQITPDNTLGAESSEINPIDEFQDRINGGATRGENLFHSFSEFNVGERTSVNFNNPVGVENIFSRVTGENISKIFGTLGVEGSANLFLINPNGIVFGENAAINVNGSFLATTANSIDFGNGSSFNAANPERPSLTISFPIGLGLGSDPGDIVVRGKGHDLTVEPFSPTTNPNSSAGLRVNSGETITLIGGNLILDGAVLGAKSGQIELISIVSEKNVALNMNSYGFTISPQTASSFGNIQIFNKSLIETSSVNNNADSGDINIWGGNVFLTDGSVMLIQNRGIFLGGNLKINASESLFVSGTDSLADANNFRINSSLRNENLGTGQSGNIQISTKRQILPNGGQILNLNFDRGRGGDINLNAFDEVQIAGRSPKNSRSYNSTISTATFGSGDAGNISLSTDHLKLLEGSSISSSVFGSGAGGEVVIDATDLVEIIGEFSEFSDPTNISATSLSSGNAGSLTINTSNLVVQDGARIDSSTFASGNSGGLTINAFNSIRVEGRATNPSNPSSIISAGNILSEELRQIFGLPSSPSGDAGNVTINTPSLDIFNGAVIGVQNQGTGNAGELQINADKITLDNASQISASTLSEEGGNISIKTENLELLNQSQITASAGGLGDGGNISIDSNAIIGLENSDIIANAVGGNGGNISINSTGVFFDPSSNITASSQLGIDGTVQINTPDINLQRELEQVAPEVVINDRPLVNRCLSRSDRSPRLILGGTGGLPQNPDSNYTSTTFSLTGVNPLPEMSTVKPLPNTQGFTEEDNAIIAADTVVRTKDGSTLLVAKSQIASPTFCEPGKFSGSTSSTNLLR